MEMAKSFFGSRDHEGYVGKEEHAVSKYILCIHIKIKLNIHYSTTYTILLIIFLKCYPVILFVV